jgi:hypothetical protein
MYTKSTNHIPPPSSTLPILKSPHTLYAIFNSKVKVQRGFSTFPAVSVLYFGAFNPFHYSPLPLPPHPIIQQLSVLIVKSFTFTDVMHFNIVDSLFLSFLLWVPQSRSTLTNMFYT